MRPVLLTALLAAAAVPGVVPPVTAQDGDAVRPAPALQALGASLASLRADLQARPGSAALATSLADLGAESATRQEELARLVASTARLELPGVEHAELDPADSLYRAARTALNQQEFAKAAQLFARVAAVKGSRYAENAGYWRAFALYRLGGRANLEAAAAALEAQSERYPEATTSRDALALSTRIQVALARAGSASAAAAVAAEASAAAGGVDGAMPAAAPGAGAFSPRPAMAPRPSRAPRPPRPPRPMAAGRMADGCAGDDEDDMRLAALNGLLQMDAERAAPILQKVLARRDAASVCLRRKAVFLVAQQRTGETERILLDAVRSDPDPEVRGQAVFWLSQVDGPRATAALDSILSRSTDDDVRDKAIFALSQQQSPAAAQALRRFARQADAPAELRGQAIFWLGQRGGMDVATLKELYGTLDDDDLKEKLIFAASQGARDGGPFLLDVARNPKESVELRKHALFWLGQTRGVAVTELLGLYGTTTDTELRDQLIFVYSQRREPQALDKLIEIAKKDRDPELRRKALFWVGQSNDPRAAQLLAEILDQ